MSESMTNQMAHVIADQQARIEKLKAELGDREEEAARKAMDAMAKAITVAIAQTASDYLWTGDTKVAVPFINPAQFRSQALGETQ